MSFSFTTKYKVLQKIGEGSFSEVLKCEERASGQLFAAKKLKKSFQNINDVFYCAELIAMQKLSKHPNVLYMLEYFYDRICGKVVFIFELMDMSMYEFMKLRKRCIPETKVRHYLYQILKGLDFLHRNGLFHRDIKPENILVKIPTPDPDPIGQQKGEVIKLADLGSIRGVYSKPPYTEYISTRWYRSPECLLTIGHYGPKMDIWAAGCVYYEILTMKPLFPGTNEVDQISKIHGVLGTPTARVLNKLKSRSKNFNTFPKESGSGLASLIHNISDEGQNILRMMLNYDPEARSNARRLLEHKYFQFLRDEERIRRHDKLTDSCITGDSVLVGNYEINKNKSGSIKSVNLATKEKVPQSGCLFGSKTTVELGSTNHMHLNNITQMYRDTMRREQPSNRDNQTTHLNLLNKLTNINHKVPNNNALSNNNLHKSSQAIEHKVKSYNRMNTKIISVNTPHDRGNPKAYKYLELNCGSNENSLNYSNSNNSGSSLSNGSRNNFIYNINNQKNGYDNSCQYRYNGYHNNQNNNNIDSNSAILQIAIPNNSIHNTMHNNSIHNNSIHNNSTHNNSIHNNGIHNNSIHNNSIHNNSNHNNSNHNNSNHNNSNPNNSNHNNIIHNTSVYNKNNDNNSVRNTSVHNNILHPDNVHTNSVQTNTVYSTNVHSNSVNSNIVQFGNNSNHNRSVHNSTIKCSSIHSNSNPSNNIKHDYNNIIPGINNQNNNKYNSNHNNSNHNNSNHNNSNNSNRIHNNHNDRSHNIGIYNQFNYKDHTINNSNKRNNMMDDSYHNNSIRKNSDNQNLIITKTGNDKNVKYDNDRSSKFKSSNKHKKTHNITSHSDHNDNKVSQPIVNDNNVSHSDHHNIYHPFTLLRNKPPTILPDASQESSTSHPNPIKKSTNKPRNVNHIINNIINVRHHRMLGHVDEGGAANGLKRKAKRRQTPTSGSIKSNSTMSSIMSRDWAHVAGRFAQPVARRSKVNLKKMKHPPAKNLATFRNTTSNLPNLLAKFSDERHKIKEEKKLTSNSFVMPKRVYGKVKLSTISGLNKAVLK